MCANLFLALLGIIQLPGYQTSKPCCSTSYNQYIFLFYVSNFTTKIVFKHTQITTAFYAALSVPYTEGWGYCLILRQVWF